MAEVKINEKLLDVSASPHVRSEAEVNLYEKLLDVSTSPHVRS